MAGLLADGVGAQSHSSASWVRLKQCLQRDVFAWPANALFQGVGLIFDQQVSEEGAAFWRKRRSYLNQPSPSYSILTSTINVWYPSMSWILSGLCCARTAIHVHLIYSKMLEIWRACNVYPSNRLYSTIMIIKAHNIILECPTQEFMNL